MKRVDLTGKQFGEWTVLKYLGNKKYLCRCSCGVEKEIATFKLTNGDSKSCGHAKNQFIDLTGQKFGEWEVLSYSGNHKWKCRCSCGEVRDVTSIYLRNGSSTSCGHNSTAFKDLRGKKFGEWEPLEYKNHLWKCRCSCGKIGLVKTYDLLNGRSKSCGHDLRHIENEVKAFSEEEINIIYEKFKQEVESYILSLNRCNYSNIDINICSNYFSSSKFIPRLYNQNKSKQSISKGIKLIHIFEYEWRENKAKLIEFLKNTFDDNIKIIYARNTEIKYIDYYEAHSFIEKYHLSGDTASSIYIGCYNDNELIGVMSFGKPRFNTNYEWELHRLCWKSGYRVVGGAEKLFNRFIKDYKVSNMISYCDASKFGGKVYKRLGFNLLELTKPNYVWIEIGTGKVLKRYQTMKNKLIELGWGSEKDTEDSIMRRKGYLKLYDCGNFKFEWRA